LSKDGVASVILSLQYLRGLAALMVVYFHSAEQLKRLLGSSLDLAHEYPTSLGSAGVDIFFVISGFIIWTTTARKPSSPGSFLYKRLIRIVPLYWGLTILVGCSIWLSPNLSSTSQFSAWHLIASLLFIPWPHPTIPGDFPVIIPGWSLNYEMAFYILFTITLLLPRRYTLATMLLILSSAVVLGHIFATGGGLVGSSFTFYTNDIILEFAGGLLLGTAFVAGIRVPWFVAFGLLLVGVSSLLIFGHGTSLPRIIIRGGPAFLIVAGVLFMDREQPAKRVGIFQLIGDASYSIYLTQVLSLPAVGKLWQLAHFSCEGSMVAVFDASCLVVATLVGVTVYLVIEKPCLSALRNFRTQNSSGSSSLRPAFVHQPEPGIKRTPIG
jgi:exopolysaccharide production protein ExoZ